MITAIATLLIAAVAQLYSTRQAAAQEIEATKKELQDTCQTIDVRAAVTLFTNRRVADVNDPHVGNVLQVSKNKLVWLERDEC